MVRMADKRATIPLLITMIAIMAQARPVAGKSHRFAPEEAPQDSALQAGFQDDLIRTASRQKPAKISSTVRPQLPLPVRTNPPQTSPSTRVANLAQPPREERNRTLQSMASPQLPPASNHRSQAASSASSLASVRARWRLMEQTIGRSLASVGAELNKTLEELYSTMGRLDRQVSKSCRQSLALLLEGLRDHELWASRLVDASAGVGGLPAGLLEGTLTDLGHFDECLAAGQRIGNDPTTGQYCSLLVKPALVGRPRLHTVCRRLPNLSPILNSNSGANPSAAANSTVRLLAQQSHQFYYAGMRLGVCVPAGCQRADVEQILQTYLDRFELIGQVKHCQRATEAQDDGATSNLAKTIDGKSGPPGRANLANFDLLQQYILLAYAILSILILLGTALDADARRGRPRNHGSTVRATNADCDGYVISGLTAEAGAHNAWQLHHQDQGDRRPAATQPEPPGVKTEPSDGRRLGPQRNPLVNFTTDIFADGQAQTPKRTHLDGLVREKPNRHDVASSELLPIYDEIHASGEQPPPGRDEEAPSGLREFLVCFSLRANFRSIARLAPPRPTGGPGARSCMLDIKVIHGLRTLSMIWIIFGHTIGLVSPEMMNNLFALADLSCSSRLLQAVLNTTLAVDTFFMISGLVTVVSFVRRCESAATVLLRPSASDSQPEFRFQHGLARLNPLRGCHLNDYQEGASLGLSGAPQHKPRSTDQASGVELTQVAGAIEQLHLDGLEVASLDSGASTTSSRSTSISSSSSNGLRSNSSSQQNFILSGATRPSVSGCLKEPQLASGWPSDFKPLSWLVMRYLRLTPAYAAVIGLSILMPALGSGPFWPETVGQLGPACRANWWTNLLYVNNFIETDKLCLIHSWYLSNDWQFFLAALFLFGIAYKSRKLALLVLLGLLVGSSAATFMISVEHDYPPTIVTTSPAVAERWEFIHTLYYKPWPHLPSYLIGLLAGCMISRLQQLDRPTPPAPPAASWLQLSPSARLICWLLSTSVALAVLNSIHPWNMGLQVDPVLAGLHSATFRTLWAACCAWLVFALVGRPKSLLALALGWRGFLVTSRLTYCAYLVHPLVIYYHFGTLRERIDSSVYGQLHRFMATLLTSYLLAFLVSACFEGPFIKLQSLFVARLATTSASSTRGSGPSASNHAGGRRRLAKDLGQSFAHSPGLSSSTSSVRGADSLDMTTMTAPRPSPAKLQPANQFVSGANSQSAACIHGDEYTFPCGHAQESEAARQPSRHYQDVLEAACNQKHNASHGGVDVEFQRKLAQAIGRGFKIRSKIVNGSTNGLETRRGGQAKRVPGLSTGESNSVAALAFEALGHKRIRSNQHKTSRKPVVARRTDAFSTFVSTSTSDGPATSHEDNR